ASRRRHRRRAVSASSCDGRREPFCSLFRFPEITGGKTRADVTAWRTDDISVSCVRTGGAGVQAVAVKPWPGGLRGMKLRSLFLRSASDLMRQTVEVALLNPPQYLRFFRKVCNPF